jgi:hypothetical protein
MKQLLPLLPFACAPAFAQAVTVDISALTPLSVTVAAGAATSTQTLPGGPLPSWQQFEAQLPAPTFASAMLAWSLVSEPGLAVAHLTNTAWVTVPNSSAQAGPHELLVRFAASAPVFVDVDIRRTLDVWPGVTAPMAAIDLGNDGTIDWPFVPVSGIQFQNLQLGPQPLLLRVLLDAACVVPGMASIYLETAVRPHNSLSVNTTVSGCPHNDVLSCEPTFADRGIDLRAPAMLSVLVVGFTPQPILFPTGWGACVLWPSPDVALVLFNSGLHIPLPAAVRPVTFWAQAVMPLTTGALLLTSGLEIQVY